DLVAEGQVKSYSEVLRYIETTKEAQELHCPVCLELWRNPVKSKCGHIFCEQCICVWKVRCKRLRIPIQCPCCRADIQSVQPVQAQSRATSVEPVESSGLRSLPRLQKFTQVGRRYLMVSGIAVQMLLLLLCADQAWNVSTSASAVLSFHAVAFGDKMYGDQYEQYRMLLGIPP
ncbi:unnamed protein product, partial [Polarella glacialis]